jgi:hypothetical protein
MLERLVGSQRTGDLSRRGAAHSIANEIHSVFHGISKRVFIGWALAAAIRSRSGRVADKGRRQGQSPAFQFTRW